MSDSDKSLLKTFRLKTSKKSAIEQNDSSDRTITQNNKSNPNTSGDDSGTSGNQSSLHPNLTMSGISTSSHLHEDKISGFLPQSMDATTAPSGAHSSQKLQQPQPQPEAQLKSQAQPQLQPFSVSLPSQGNSSNSLLYQSFNKPVSKSGSSREVRKPSVASTGTNNLTSSIYKISNTSGNRTSTVSNYSGVVQNVDIDTIKYVGNKESLQLSHVNGISPSSSEHMLVMHSPNHSSASLNSGSSHSFVDMKSKIPRTNTLDSENMAKIIKSKTEKSPIRKNALPPPSSPLPVLQDSNQQSQIHSSPLKNKQRSKHNRSSSSSSAASSHLHARLDDIMKEVDNLKLEFEDERPLKSTNADFNASSAALRSMSSIAASAQGTHSFYTAHSEESDFDDNNDVVNEKYDKDNANENFADFDDNKTTENLNIASPKTLDPSISTSKYKQPSSSHRRSTGASTIIPKQENTKAHSKSSSNSNQSNHGHHSKSSSSHKSKKRSSRPKSKIKPFSYDTLAKLLNATDGIIIGQEFAALNIPTKEKFLIERIVDSISRLTANMILNPARYDQSCARLERVLNVLEGFE